MSVDVVLATFNGGRFLREQLDSLLVQSFSDFRVLVGDDGSSDETLAIVAEYSRKNPDRFFFLEAALGLGACGNFARLLSESTGDYVFLSDQDDVWDREKMSLSLEAIKSLEAKVGENTPLLVHTDLLVVDDELRLISQSFFDFQHLDSRRTDFRDLLFQNTVTGCSVVMNRALVRKALPVPSAVVMHDWWLALVASSFGYIGFVNRPLISYRQHSSNQVGAKGWSATYVLKRLRQLSSKRVAANLGDPIIRQARAFFERFQHELSSEQLRVVCVVSGFDKCSGISRVVNAAMIRARKHGVLRTIAFYWLLLRAEFVARL